MSFARSLISATLAVPLAASGFAASAAAQTQQSVTVTGQTNQVCIMASPVLGDGAMENFNTPAGNVYVIQELADPSTLTTRAAQLTLSMTTMCNSVHRVVVASENAGLWRTEASAPASGFGSAVPYTLQLDWADETRSYLAEAGARQVQQWELLVGRANAGDMLLGFSIDAGATNQGFNAPLLAGVYSDVVTVTVETQ
jgi:hypothetical protein